MSVLTRNGVTNRVTRGRCESVEATYGRSADSRTEQPTRGRSLDPNRAGLTLLSAGEKEGAMEFTDAAANITSKKEAQRAYREIEDAGCRHNRLLRRSVTSSADEDPFWRRRALP